MTGGSCLTDLGDFLVLRRTDAVFEASLTAIQQAVQRLHLLRQQAGRPEVLPETAVRECAF